MIQIQLQVLWVLVFCLRILNCLLKLKDALLYLNIYNSVL